MVNDNEILRGQLFEALKMDLENIKEAAQENPEILSGKKSLFITLFEDLNHVLTLKNLVSLKANIDRTKLEVLKVAPTNDEQADSMKKALSKLLELDSCVSSAILEKLKYQKENLHPFTTWMQRVRLAIMIAGPASGLALVFFSILSANPFTFVIGVVMLFVAARVIYDHHKESKDMDAKIVWVEEDQTFSSLIKNVLDNSNLDLLQKIRTALELKQQRLQYGSPWSHPVIGAVWGTTFVIVATVIGIVVSGPFAPLAAAFLGALGLFLASRLDYLQYHAQQIEDTKEKLNIVEDMMRVVDSLANVIEIAPSNKPTLAKSADVLVINDQTSVLYINTKLEAPLKAQSMAPALMPVLNPISSSPESFFNDDEIEMKTVKEKSQNQNSANSNNNQTFYKRNGKGIVQDEIAYQPEQSKIQRQNSTFENEAVDAIFEL